MRSDIDGLKTLGRTTEAPKDYDPSVLDRLMGTAGVRKAVESGELGALFQGWIDAHDEFEKTKVCLY
jgi:hypothetical protein